jgi:aminoglycoside phosphotransferase family enzyme
MTAPAIEEKVAFLSRPEAYPNRVQRVETKETHMSWVFLTDTQAWKLKKPVRTEYLDFSTLEARRRDSLREVRLNRRLAKDVYLGIVPLAMKKQGHLQLGGKGTPVDWLVCMRRLPADLMLDDMIARHAVLETDILKLASLLAAFYKKACPVPMTGSQYRARLAAHLEGARIELIRVEYGLSADVVEPVIRTQMKCLQENSRIFDARTRTRKIIEAHGDLRPEHVCLEAQPVVIDCLEFNRDLRILDAASELAFLALECERLGAPHVGEIVLGKYIQETGDRPADVLLDFYRSYHACIRAKIAIWHIRDGIPDRAKWIRKANEYLSAVRSTGKPANAA